MNTRCRHGLPRFYVGKKCRDDSVEDKWRSVLALFASLLGSRVSTRFGLKVSGWEISGADRSRGDWRELMGGREMIKETLCCVVKGKGSLMGKRGEVMHVPRLLMDGNVPRYLRFMI